ncbi:uncharacterized protein LOC126884606 [Diabrotica virgifera virgifera]|uniref:Protein LST7 n=1 Tax=Diabrotica virgifera virgifera TaxID=50390 RepID=A0A6P7GCA9_DIAVI|nr:uncharacterized protein LOC126884606 [Diabrotica virgifera virgifera]
MEVIIAMGHFCDTHGPCVILCTEAFDKIPEKPSCLKVPICSACESIKLDTVYACEDERKQYITSRTSFDSKTSHLLKDAILRSLSIEMVLQDGKTSGTMYFGDNTRGHIIAHVFSVKDSFSRGFKRKYCIIVLGKQQISLLSHYDFIENNLKKISEGIQQKADKLNTTERSSTNNMEKVLRSLPELIGESAIYAQLHMWFVFLLRSKIFQRVPHNIPSCPVDCSSIEKLRNVKLEMSDAVYDTIAYCVLTGIHIEEVDTSIVKYFQELLPKGFKLPSKGQLCTISKIKDIWNVKFEGSVPLILPRLHTCIKEALEDTSISNSALYHQIKSLIMHWYSISCVLSWSKKHCDNLMRTLEIHKCDMPLLSYWIPQSGACVELCKTDYFKYAKIS